MYKDCSKLCKIYDLMLVNTELDWLEILLGQMQGHVDYFIFLEASMTFHITQSTLNTIATIEILCPVYNATA
jgi:hypothetical protein